MKKTKVITIYSVLILIIGIIAAHNEVLSTGAAIALWYAVPMALTYALAIGVVKKVTLKNSLIIAIVNTLVMFLAMSFLGMMFLNQYFELTF